MRFLGVSFLIVLGLASPSLAQPMVPGGGYQKPTVSPYINLVRGNSGVSNAALNYFGVVRPEQAFRSQATMLQQQLAQTNQNLTTLSSDQQQQQPLSITGKGATFQNYSHYFNNIGGSAGGGGSSFGSRGAGSFGSGMPAVGISTGGGSSGRGIQAPSGGGGARRR